MAAINTKLGSSFLKFTFSDEDDNVIAWFRINPFDLKLAQRFQEASEFFKHIKDQTPETPTREDLVRFNNEIEEKICHILGYDAKDSLFGQISATSVMSDGTMFVNIIVEKILSSIGPEIERRQKSMNKAVEKHTAKYADQVIGETQAGLHNE